jgi:hypothetical protein
MRGQSRAKGTKRGARTRTGATKTKTRAGRKDASAAPPAEKRGGQTRELNKTAKRESSNRDESTAALRRSLAEAHRREAATAEMVQVISRSDFDLQAVLESLVENAVRLCEAHHGLIYRQDGEVYRVAASYGHSPEFVQSLKRHPIPMDRTSATGRAVLERGVIHIHDVLADTEYRWGEGVRLHAEMHRTILAVPMLRELTTIGGHCDSPDERQAFHRKTDQVAHYVCQPGVNSHRKHTAAERGA